MAIDENKLKTLEEIFRESISLSKAHIEKEIIIPYEPIATAENTPPHNPLRKNLDIDLYGCPEEVMQASSGIFALTESSSDFHITPETNPNCMSFRICTCGNKTHPILSLRNVLEKLDPTCGKICYYKEGYDIAPRKSGFPKTIEGVIKKYYELFDISRYRFEAQEVKQFEYEIYFYDPLRLRQKTASIIGVEWPLNEETKKTGIYIDDREFVLHKNGNGNGSEKADKTEKAEAKIESK